MTAEDVVIGGSPNSISSSDRSSEVPNEPLSLTQSNGAGGNMAARQLPVLFSLGTSHTGDANGQQQFLIPAAPEIPPQLPQMTTVVTISTDESPGGTM